MRILAIVILSFILTLGVSAQDTLSLTFQEAVNIALENNITLKQEKNIQEISVAERNQSKALYLPSINAYTDFVHTDGRQFDQTTGQLYTTSSDRGSMGLSANYTIFDGLNRLNTNRSTKYSLIAQDNRVKRTEQEIIYTVGSQYLQVLLDNELLRIARNNLEVQQTTLSQIKGFVEMGTRPLSHQLDQEAIVRKLETQVIRTENKLRLDKAMLMQTLLLDPELVMEPVEPDWGMESILATDPDMDVLFETALERRPDLTYLRAVQMAVDASVKVVKSYHYPTLEAFARYGSGYTSLMSQVNPETGDTERIPYIDQIREYNPTSQFGLQLSIPIYNQHMIHARKVRARMEYENTNLKLQDLELQIFREVQNAYLDFKAAKNEYFAAEAQFKAGQEAYNIQKERYDVGVGDLVELAKSTDVFVEAAASRAQAAYYLLFQKYILDYYTGTLNASNL